MRRQLAWGWVAVVVAACGGRTSSTSGSTPSTITSPSTSTSTSTKLVEEVSLAEVGLHEEYLDKAVDPCEDFFAFACGGWLKTTEIPADQARWGMFNDIYKRNEKVLHEALDKAARDPGDDPVMKKLGDYHAACMDEAAVEKAGLRALKPLFAASKKVRDLPSLAAAIPELHRSGIFVLFIIDAVQDRKDATRVIADIDQSGLGLPGRDYYLDPTPAAETVRKRYQGYVERLLRLRGMPASAARTGAADVLKIETALARAMLSPVEQRDPVATYNRINRDGLAREAPLLGWDNYFRVLGRADLHDVTVHSVDYTRAVDDLLRKFRAAQWQAYLDFHIVHAMAPYLGKRFVDESFQYAKLVTGQKEQRARWKRCVSFADADLGEALAQPFVARSFSGASKAAAETMVREIVRAFGDALPGVDWMDDATRAKAKDKLRKLDLMVGYPDEWRKYDFVVARDDLAGNTLRATRFEIQRKLAKIGKPVDRGEFQYTPQTVNAYYEASLNQVVLLAGILQPPFYHVDSSVAVNLGGMGMIVGHELTHGFDDEGGAVRRRRQPGELVARRHQRPVPRADRLHGQVLQRLRGAARPAAQRRPHQRREHRRRRRPEERLPRLPRHAQGRAEAPGRRRLHRGPAVLHRPRPGLVREDLGGMDAHGHGHRPALTGALPRQWPGKQLPGVLGGVPV
jgi:putative endopeptidase